MRDWREWHYGATYRPRKEGATTRARYRRMVERHEERWRDTPPMSLDEYVAATAKDVCTWCGADALGSSRSSVGLDRIDNAQGYVVGNVVPACPSCNCERGTLTFEEYTLVWKLRRSKREAHAYLSSALAVEWRGVRARARQALLVTGRPLPGRPASIPSGVSGFSRTTNMDACKQELARRIALRDVGLDPDRELPPPPASLADVPAWRALHGLTQEQAAALVGVGRRTVQRVEAEGGRRTRKSASVVDELTRALSDDV